MTYDVGYRFAQALDPSGLDTIAACLHAIQAAAKDCRNAGKPFEPILPWYCSRNISAVSRPTACRTEPNCARCAARRSPRSLGRRC